jgi:hypothetical protein
VGSSWCAYQDVSVAGIPAVVLGTNHVSDMFGKFSGAALTYYKLLCELLIAYFRVLIFNRIYSVGGTNTEGVRE